MLVRAVFGLNKVDFRRIAKLDEYLYYARRQTFALSHCVARGRVTEVLLALLRAPPRLAVVFCARVWPRPHPSATAVPPWQTYGQH